MRSYVALAAGLWVTACASSTPVQQHHVGIQPVAYIIDVTPLPADAAFPAAEKPASTLEKPPTASRVFWFFGDHGG